MANPDLGVPEEPAQRRFNIFGIQLTGCGCLLVAAPILILFLIWLFAVFFAGPQSVP